MNSVKLSPGVPGFKTFAPAVLRIETGLPCREPPIAGRQFNQ